MSTLNDNNESKYYKQARKDTVAEVCKIVEDVFEMFATVNGPTWNYKIVGECEIVLKNAIRSIVESEE